jgi:SAM-dependent methyltransferase
MVALGYDAVYAAIPRSPTLRAIWRDHALDGDYPEGFEHISFVTAPELTTMASELRLTPEDTLVDLACGAGGPGLWVGQATGAQLVGVDISAVGIRSARERARHLRLESRARFQEGTFSETGLPNESLDAAMSVDALQYAPDKRAALREVSRILHPGSWFVFMAFELEPPRVIDLPVLSVDPVPDYEPLLDESGFSVSRYEETEGWSERLTTTYEAIRVNQATLNEEMGDVAVAALLTEVILTLERRPYRRRVFVSATKR